MRYMFDQFRYILDPKEVYGEDFPGETFRVLKEKEIKQFGEYRTRRMVLEAWDKLEGVMGPVSSVQYSVNSEPANSVPVPGAEPVREKVVEVKPEPALKKEPQAAEADPAQPMLSDFGLYKCPLYWVKSKHHEKEKHGGREVEWRKLK
jgi:hypothetical protein